MTFGYLLPRPRSPLLLLLNMREATVSRFIGRLETHRFRVGEMDCVSTILDDIRHRPQVFGTPDPEVA